MVKIKPVKVRKRDNCYLLYFYSLPGERRRISVGSDFQHAQRLTVKFYDWLLEGKDPEFEFEREKQNHQAQAITLRSYFQIFMQRHGKLQSKNMQEAYHYRFKNIERCPELADVPIGDVSKRIILDYMHARMEQDGVKPATVNKDTSLVKCMLNRATEWDMLDRNPLQGMKLFRESEKRKVYITPDEASQLLAEVPEPIAYIVEFAIYSGFRKENILSLKIEQIRFHDLSSTADVELKIKGGRKETFSLGETAVTVLTRVIGNRSNGYIFINPTTGTRYTSIHKSFNRAVRKLGFQVNGTKLRFHDLRHVFATWLHRQGVSLDVFKRTSGAS